MKTTDILIYKCRVGRSSFVTIREGSVMNVGDRIQ